MMASIIQRYLNMDVFHNTGEVGMRARKSPKENENAFAERIEEASRDCTHVYTEHELVRTFFHGLPCTK